MNIDTGELIRLKQSQPVPGGFVPIPRELQREANKHLSEKDSVIVDLSSNGPLSKWAKAQRKKRRKAVRESRKQNRK
ncbi:hypothetical protein MKX70_24250 [Paenibacillus sp. FSL R7-0312]|uniref:hypothetical protein n=1 Tax=Paenibacillus sp. FSL R7-0312 TaxID=2921682 RepID=UPI0030F6765A